MRKSNARNHGVGSHGIGSHGTTIIVETAEQFDSLDVPRQFVFSRKLNREIEVPCLNTILVAPPLVVANDYNPNSVSGDKLELLRTSIIDNGWCFPVATVRDTDRRAFVVVDGFHRKLIGSGDWLDMEYIPIVVLAHNLAQRMAATIQFNKARGIHQVDLDADVVRALIYQGMTEEEVSEKLGMEIDAVHRYKQLTGIVDLFKNVTYSTAWEMEDDAGR